MHKKELQVLLLLRMEYIFRSTEYFSVCVKSSSLLYFIATFYFPFAKEKKKRNFKFRKKSLLSSTMQLAYMNRK